MTETRTTRFGLPQWSSGSDSGSRTDFNEAFDNLEDRAAYDDGETYTALPGSTLVQGRYALVQPESSPGVPGPYQTLYRRSETATWDAVGGNALPDPVAVRPYLTVAGGGPAVDATGLTLAHPDLAQPGGTLAYDGSAYLGGTLRSYDRNDAGKGSVLVGLTDAAAPTTLGRLHVRTRQDNDRGIVVRPHGTGAGNLYTAQNTGGSEVWSVDALGRMRQVTYAAFGGASLPSQSMLAVAPSSSASDGVVNGLLLYGHDNVDPAISGKTMLRISPDNTTDTTPIVSVSRTAIALGRLPWGTSTTGGTVTTAGRQMVFRGLGYTADQAVAAFKLASSSAPENPANDVNLFVVNREALSGSVSAYLSNHRSTATPGLTVYRYGSTAPAVQLAQATVDGGGNTTYSLISEWAGDGRLKAGALWRGAGILRDARQSVKHSSIKKWATTGDGPTAGQVVSPNSSFTYTWPAMTLRSYGSTDLVISTIIELMLIPDGVGNGEDAQPVNLRTEINIAGGGWFTVADGENAPISVGIETGHRAGGNVFTARHRLANVSGDESVQIRTRVAAGSSLLALRLRMLDLLVEECCLQTYTAT